MVAVSEREGTERGPALAALYRSEAPGLRALAYLLTGSPGVAEDVVQDAFAAVAPRLGGLDNPAAYLRTVVVNGARRQAGRAAAERRRFSPDREHDAADAANVADAAATSSPTDRLAVRRALAELSADQREAVVLRFFADLTFREIGELLACPTQTAATNVRRGLARLRTHLEDQ